MNFKAIRNLITIPVLAIGLAACASSANDPNTHRYQWYAKEAKTERDYKVDQAHCHDAHEMEPGKPVALDSLSIEGYRNCMMAKGYVLRHY